MEKNRDTFMSWLRDAHAAEKQALTMMHGQVNRLEHYPTLRTRIEQHIHETDGQLRILEELLIDRDGNASMIKDVTGCLMAFAQNLGGMMANDEVVKGAIFNHAFEQMEIASYHVLITTAEKLGDTAAAAALHEILQQEEDMAAWLVHNLSSITETYLDRRAADQQARP